MDDRLRRRFDRLETQQAALLARLDGLGDDLLNRTPGEGEWSVIQVLCHLCLAEELSVGYMREKMKGTASAAGLTHRLKSSLLSLALRSPLRFRAPGRSTEVPDWEALSVVAGRWGAARRELEEILDDQPAEMVDRAIFKHPRVGMISLDQTLRFVEEHIAHHERQIERVLARVF